MSRPLFVANTGPRMGSAIADPILSERLMFDKPGALNGRRGGLFGAGRSVFSLLNFCRNMGQGACAGLLTLLGATHLTGVFPNNGAETAALAGPIDTATLENLSSSLLAGGAPGVLEIIGAIALFLNAGQGLGRILGLMAFVVIAVAHANGVSHTEFVGSLSQLSEFARTATGSLAGFM